MEFLPTDWLSILSLDTPLLELVARGTVLYFGILVMTRLMPRRTGGELAMMDLIFVLLIAEAAAHAMGEYTSVADGVVMIATLMGWNYLINAPQLPRALHRAACIAPAAASDQGRQALRRNMRREFLTDEELMSHLREEGIGDVKEVKSAHIEGDGKISVISNRR